MKDNEAQPATTGLPDEDTVRAVALALYRRNLRKPREASALPGVRRERYGTDVRDELDDANGR